MAQERKSIYVGAPGFRGLNTQDSPVTQDSSFASIAENAIIDKFGRIGAREGLNKLTSSTTPLGSSAGIESVFEFTKRDGTTIVFSTGNNKIFTGTTSLTDVTNSMTISANNWKIISFNGDAYFFQRGHDALEYTTSAGTIGVLSSHAPDANEACAAFGRIWAGDVTGNKYTLHFSDTLDGDDWTGGTSGSLDLTTVWPTGFDEIVAIREFNNFLVIFGKQSILLYSGASAPASMALSDVITGIGCVARDSVQDTGTDLIFLSDSGVRSLGRTIQEKSNPIGNVSKNVRDDIIFNIGAETGNIKSAYSPENAFYLLFFPSSSLVFCFDMRGTLEDGSNRVTTWPATKILCGTRGSDGTLYLGTAKGINDYSGYLDDTSPYTMKYYTQPLSFGDASRLKILKELTFKVIGGQGSTLVLNWGYDYTEAYAKQSITIVNSSIAEYGIAEYNVAASEYSASIIVDDARVKSTGSGTVATIGVDAIINNRSLSIQELKTEALIGRLV